MEGPAAGGGLCAYGREWCWYGDLVSDCRTTGPFLMPPSPSPKRATPKAGLFVEVGGGRNYTRDDPLLLGRPAFHVGLSFVGGTSLILTMLPPTLI